MMEVSVTLLGQDAIPNYSNDLPTTAKSYTQNANTAA